MIARRRQIGIVVLIVIAVFMTGCSTFLNRPAIREDERNLENVLNVLSNNYHRLKTMRGWAKLSIDASSASFQANAYILLKNPDSLFVKIEAFLGIDVVTLFFDRDSFKVYSPFQNSYYYGPIDSLKSSPVIPFDIPHDKLLQVISGLETLQGVEEAVLQTDDKSIIVDGSYLNQRYKCFLDTRSGIVRQCEVSDSQDELLFVEKFDRVFKTEGVRIPRTITVFCPKKKQSLTLFYTELMVNQRIKAREFEIKIPQNAVKIKS